MNQFKKCGGKCKRILPLEDFYLCRSGRDGRDSRCKDCAKAWQKEVHDRNIINGKDYSTPQRKTHLRNAYGMTLEEYNKKCDAQQNRCAICGQEETIVIHGTLCNLSVDHNHATNVNRDLLCRRCNTIIGHANDNIELLVAASEYLRRHMHGRDNF